MAKHVVFLSIPHLRPEDVEKMASLTKLREAGPQRRSFHSFRR